MMIPLSIAYCEKLKKPVSCNLIFKKVKMQYQKYLKIQFRSQLYIDIWEIILYLQANPERNSLLYIDVLLHGVIV